MMEAESGSVAAAGNHLKAATAKGRRERGEEERDEMKGVIWDV